VSVSRQLKFALSRGGLNRSLLVRRLTQIDHERLRKLRARAMGSEDYSSRMLRLLMVHLENGILRVPQGRGQGLIFDMHYLPISHAHAGSIACGNLETSVQEAMVRHLGPAGVFYDIGANVGFFSLLAARLTGFDHGRVFAFEPAPDNAEAIRRNAELNGVPNITVVAKAASSQTGVGRLQIVDDQSWSRLEEFGGHPYTERVLEVELVTIDELVKGRELPPPSLVKIDVEGAELAVLAGMRQTIEEHGPAIICELHDTHGEFVAAMREHRYRLVNLEASSPIEEAGASAHALALPPESTGD
jgi:FkbM family methyltransferase